MWIPAGIYVKNIPSMIPNIALYKWEWRMLVLVRLGLIITRIVFQLIPREFLKYNSTIKPAIAVNKKSIKDNFK